MNCRNVTNYDYDHLVFTQQWAQSVCDCDDSGVSACVKSLHCLFLNFVFINTYHT